MSEFDKLVKSLIKYEIPFKVNSLFDGYQLRVDSIKDFDAVCHSCSYGGPEGYIEIMGLTTSGEKELGGVVGWLSADSVLTRILKALGIPYNPDEHMYASWEIKYGSVLEDGSTEVTVYCSNCKEHGSVFDEVCPHCGVRMKE